MSKKTTLAAGTSPFAHLLGGLAALAGVGRGGNRADNEDQKDPDAEDDELDPDAEEQDVEQPDGKKKGEGDDDTDAEDEDEDVDPDAEEPDDEKEAKGFRAGRAAERRRIDAIFSSPAAAGKPDMAAFLACRTRNSSAEAIGILASTGKPATTTARGRSLDERMSARNDARPGADAAGSGKGASLASKMIAVGERLGQVVKP